MAEGDGGASADELAQKLKPLGEQERAVILELKEAECAKRDLPFDGRIHAWDMRYYMNQVEETRYRVDQNLLKEYFPMQVVTRGLLAIYQELLGLTFTLEEGAAAWHEDVRLYSVRDAASGEEIGKFYLDLYPRWEWGPARTQAWDRGVGSLGQPGAPAVGREPLPGTKHCLWMPHYLSALTSSRSPGKGSMATQPALACSLAAYGRMAAGSWPSLPWWPISPSPHLTYRPCCSMMRWRPTSTSSGTSCTSYAPRSVLGPACSLLAGPGPSALHKLFLLYLLTW